MSQACPLTVNECQQYRKKHRAPVMIHDATRNSRYDAVAWKQKRVKSERMQHFLHELSIRHN
jgi:hypothetical protein